MTDTTTHCQLTPVKVGQALHCIDVDGDLHPGTITRITARCVFVDVCGRPLYRLNRAHLETYGRCAQTKPDLLWATDEALDQQKAEMDRFKGRVSEPSWSRVTRSKTEN